MIDILVCDEKAPLKNIWYQKTNNIKSYGTYSITLNLDNHLIRKFLFDYLGHNNNRVVDDVLKKECTSGSLGIIWHLIQFFENHDNNDINEHTTLPYYMLSTVDKVSSIDSNLVIEGKYKMT